MTEHLVTPRDAASSVAEATSLLAAFLYAEAGSEPVRTREALAAALINRVDYQCVGHEMSACIDLRYQRSRLLVDYLQHREVAQPSRTPSDDALWQSCLRIAQRAIHGALQDPTRGSTGFCRLGSALCAAGGIHEGVPIGSYVFYHDRGVELGVEATRDLMLEALSSIEGAHSGSAD